MAFFDDLGKKLSQAGQTAVQKTKDLTEIAKLNSSISDEEKKINLSFIEIGKMYFAKYKDSHDSEFDGLFSTIADAEKKIEAYKQQIGDIKGVVRCEKCGAEVQAGVAFCSACGAAMPKPEPAAAADDMAVCSECGAKVPKDSKFCTSCGKPMTDSSDDDASSPAE